MQTNVKPGTVLRHHSGRIYTVIALANTEHPSEKFPVMMVYIGTNGNIWSRALADCQGKFSILH